MERTPMTCLAFRRQALADPRHLSAEAEAHRQDCPGCADDLERLRRLDERLAAAARVPVPEGLADRVLLRTELGSRGISRRYALAAGLLLPVVMAVSALWLSRYEQPALAAIEHVLAEEPHELAIGRNGDSRVLGMVLGAAGLSLSETGFGIRYLGTCPFRGGFAHHVLLETPLGRATLLISPDQPLASTVVANARSLSAVAMPARAGSFAVVADTGEHAYRIANAIRP